MSCRLVIMILVDVANGKQRHVPYRDSKLTFLLQVRHRWPCALCGERLELSFYAGVQPSNPTATVGRLASNSVFPRPFLPLPRCSLQLGIPAAKSKAVLQLSQSPGDGLSVEILKFLIKAAPSKDEPFLPLSMCSLQALLEVCLCLRFSALELLGFWCMKLRLLLSVVCLQLFM